MDTYMAMLGLFFVARLHKKRCFPARDTDNSVSESLPNH